MPVYELIRIFLGKGAGKLFEIGEMIVADGIDNAPVHVIVVVNHDVSKAHRLAQANGKLLTNNTCFGECAAGIRASD